MFSRVAVLLIGIGMNGTWSWHTFSAKGPTHLLVQPHLLSHVSHPSAQPNWRICISQRPPPSLSFRPLLPLPEMANLPGKLSISETQLRPKFFVYLDFYSSRIMLSALLSHHASSTKSWLWIRRNSELFDVLPSFTHSHLQQILIEYLLCSRHCLDSQVKPNLVSGAR